MKWKLDERSAVRAQAVGALTGFDTRSEKEFLIYAQSLAFLPDGRLYLGHTGAGLKLWDPETGQLETKESEVSGPLAIRPDGAALQLGPTYTTRDRPERSPLDARPDPRFPLQVLEVERQVIARTISDPVEGGSRLLAWTIAPQGSHVAAAVVDRQSRQHLFIWNTATGNLLQRIARRPASSSPALPGVGLTFAPDGSLLASWDESGRIELLGVPDGQLVAGFTARNPVNCVAFGQNHWVRTAPRLATERWMLAIGDADGSITLWNPGSQSVSHVLRAWSYDILSLAFSPDGTLLASTARGGSHGQLWDVATGCRLVELGMGDYATALAFSPDGKRLMSSQWSAFSAPADRAKTQVFALDPGRGIRHLHGLPDTVAKTEFSRDGKRIAALSWDWWAAVWERDTGRLLRLMAVPRGKYPDNAGLALSPDGRRLAVSAGNTASLFDLATGESQRWTLPGGLTEAIVFPNPDQLLLFRTEVRDGSRSPGSDAPSAEYPLVCVLRDLLCSKPNEPLKIIRDFNRRVQNIYASPDGTYFMIDGVGGPGESDLRHLRRAYASDGTFLRDLPTQLPVNSTNFGPLLLDPTGKILVQVTSPAPSRQVMLEMPSGRYLGQVTAGPVLALSPGARHLAVSDGNDPHLRLYDRDGQLLVENLGEWTEEHSVRFSPDLDGRYLVWGSPSGLVSLADLVVLQRKLATIGLGW